MSVEQWMIGPQLVGLIMLSAGILQKVHPPTDIDGLYGYRTPTSKQNQQTFDEGNRYSSRLLIRMGLATLVIGLLIAPFIDNKHQIINVALILIAGIGISTVTISLTEKHLNKMFDNKLK